MVDQQPKVSASSTSPVSFLLLTAFSVVASFLFVFHLELRPIIPGLDPSFVWAFNYAATKGWTWGTDFISTYGPYGYLTRTVDIGDLVVRRAIFDVLLTACVGIAAAVYVFSLLGLRTGSRVIAAVLLIYSVSIQSEDEYISFCFLLLVLLSGLGRPGPASLLATTIAGALSGFYLLMKFSLGFPALGTVAVACVLGQSLLSAFYRLGTAACAATTTFFVGWVTYQDNLRGVGDYLATGWDLSRGYSSAMSYSARSGWIGVAAFFLLFVVVAVWSGSQRDRKSLLSAALLVFPLFSAWKHAIVRQDGHVFILTTFGFFVVTVLFVQALAASRACRALPLVGLSAALLVTPPLSDRSIRAQLWPRVARPVASLDGRNWIRLANLAAYRESMARWSEADLRPKILSESVRRTIGRSPVDIYPWEISYVPANDLVWKNRPLPASFSSYTPFLDHRNAAFFTAAATRPQYLLWHHDWPLIVSIDSRHLFFDEPNTVRTIVSYYDQAMCDPEVTLLRAREAPRLGAPEPLQRATIPWKHWVEVPQLSSGVLLASSSFEPTLLLRIIRIVFRQGPVYLTLRFANAEEMRFRLVPENAESGLWIDPFPATINELRSLLGEGRARHVVAVRFDAGFIDRLSSGISLTWTKLRPLTPPRSDISPAAGKTSQGVKKDKDIGPCVSPADHTVSGTRDWYGRTYD